MANSKIQTLITKIQSIIGSEDSVSRLEKDLVKGYLRELYELSDALPLTGSTTISKESPAIREMTNSKPTYISAAPQEKEEPRPYFTPQTTEKITTPIEIGEASEPYSTPNGRTDNQKSEVRSFEAAGERRSISAIPEVLRSEPLPNKKYESLFESSRTRDLSDKLSRSPIADLGKAFSINDRILVVADLFGGDQHKFQETLDILNTKYSLEEARSFLIRYIVDRYNWLEEDRSERAREFIKLVERRYL